MGYFYWKMFLRVPQTAPMTGEEYVKNFEKLMRADVVGGQTPEETLKMFIAELRKEDAGAAAQYFLLDDEGKRDKWVTYLQDIKDKQLMQKMANDLEEAKADLESVISGSDYNFVVLDSKGDVSREVNLELNKFSGLWKIESI